MSSPSRVSQVARNARIVYFIAAFLFWIQAALLLALTSLEWVAALEFVAGLVALLLWQIRPGQRSISS